MLDACHVRYIGEEKSGEATVPLPRSLTLAVPWYRQSLYRVVHLRSRRGGPRATRQEKRIGMGPNFGRRSRALSNSQPNRPRRCHLLSLSVSMDYACSWTYALDFFPSSSRFSITERTNRCRMKQAPPGPSLPHSLDLFDRRS